MEIAFGKDTHATTGALYQLGYYCTSSSGVYFWLHHDRRKCPVKQLSRYMGGEGLFKNSYFVLHH